MAQINVTQFAKELGLPPALLIEQLQAAGVKRALTADTALTEKDKTQLLDYLRQSHGAKEAKQKITLTRRQTTEIKKSDGTGKSRTIQVEVRKKRVLVKREATEPEAVEAPKPVVDAEQAAMREAEAKQQAQLAARQAEEVERKAEKAEQDRRKKEAVVEAQAPVVEAKVEAKVESPQAAQAVAAGPAVPVEAGGVARRVRQAPHDQDPRRFGRRRRLARAQDRSSWRSRRGK
jgi:translation initiation factor IF-2